MKHMLVRKSVLALGSMGLIVSVECLAFPSAAWFPMTPSAITLVNESNPNDSYEQSMTSHFAYVNGQKVHIAQDDDGIVDFFHYDANGLHWHGGRNSSSPGCTLTLSPAVNLPDDIALGTPYTTTGTATAVCPGSGIYTASFSATITPQAFESVTTAGAGTYTALKWQFAYTVDAPISKAETFTEWSVPKVGLIKTSDGITTYSATNIASAARRFRPTDFDDDDRTDQAVYRGTDGTFRIRQSTDNSLITRQFGLNGDRAAPGDFDGDGKEDFTVFRPNDNTWYILKSSTGFTKMFYKKWGVSGDQTVQRDYDGDGVFDIAVYRPSNGMWYVLKSSTGFTEVFSKQFGIVGDNPVPRDFDGDGKADLAVFRPSNGNWYVLTSSSGYNSFNTYVGWGKSGDQPIARDYDGDGKADLCVYRPSNATWYIKFSSSGYTTSLTKSWGIPTMSYSAGVTDTPVAGDFDGDHIIDIAIFRPSNGKWYVLTSSSGFQSSLVLDSLGTTDDLPLLRK